MSRLFQLGVVLLFIVGAVKCKEQRIFRGNDLRIQTYERTLQRGDEVMLGCGVCKKILQKIFTLIGKELSRDNINMALNKVCGKMKVIEIFCLKFINKYKEKLVRAIMSAQNAPGACRHLGLCKKPKV